MTEGRIIKALAGFYYVETPDGEIYACHAKGLFRKNKEKPLVGDIVSIEITDTKDMEGSIRELLPRVSELSRPPVANVDRVLIIQSLADPAPRLSLTDRYLLMCEARNITPIIGFSKLDLVNDELPRGSLPDEISSARDDILARYRAAGYQLLFFSSKTGEGLADVRAALRGHINTVAGPSGAGKSSLINALCGDERMETGDISKKLGRGKQTTRHTELLRIAPATLICDTPGFGSIDLPDIRSEELSDLYPEYRELSPQCRFAGCSHITEPDCAVRAAVESGELNPARFDDYAAFYRELSARDPYR